MDQLFCTACGHRLGPGDQFCTACGAPVAAPSTLAPASAPAPNAQNENAQNENAQNENALSIESIQGARSVPVEQTVVRQPIAPSPQDSRVHPAAARTPLRRPRSRTHSRLRFWSWVGAAAVVVGAISYALGTLAESADQPRAVPSQPSVSATRPTPRPSPKASIDPQAMAQARALHTLITQSATDKQRIATAATQLQSCDHLAQAIQTFEEAAASRDGLVEQASGLAVGLLPGGGEAVADLRSALRASADADRAYVAWGESRHKVTITVPGSRGHGRKHHRPQHRQVCRGGADLEARAVELSTASHGAKQETARAWNIVAAQFGLPTISWSDL